MFACGRMELLVTCCIALQYARRRPMDPRDDRDFARGACWLPNLHAPPSSLSCSLNLVNKREALTRM